MLTRVATRRLAIDLRQTVNLRIVQIEFNPNRFFTDVRLPGRVNMVDKSSLRLLGFLFAGIAVAVTLIAAMVVREHVTGRLQLYDVAMASRLATTVAR